MARTITQQGFIYQKVGPHHGIDDFAFIEFDFGDNDPDYIKVCPHTLTFVAPDNKAVMQRQVQALEAQKAELERKFNLARNEIESRISSLLCIENAASTS